MTPKEMIKKLRSGRIDEIDICGYEIANTIESLLTGPPQIKELSDEEITEVLNDENIAEYHQGNWLVLPYAFARAILRKAQEK